MPREFLVHRLMDDVRAKKGGSGGSSNSDEERSDVSSEERNLDQIDNPYGPNDLASRFLAHQFQYAAAMATLARAKFIPGSNDPLSLLYPQFYPQMMNFNNPPDSRGQPKSPATPRKKTATPKKEKKALEIKNFSAPHPLMPEGTPAGKTESGPRKRTPMSTSMKNGKEPKLANGPKRARHIRKLQFEDETASPVSGMFIRDSVETKQMEQLQPKVETDLEDAMNFVHVTEQAKEDLAKIPNFIGAYVCQLCKEEFGDAFKLAAHCCPRIGHVEYRCQICSKVFNCPANLASHQRWHKPWRSEKRGSVGGEPEGEEGGENDPTDTSPMPSLTDVTDLMVDAPLNLIVHAERNNNQFNERIKRDSLESPDESQLSTEGSSEAIEGTGASAGSSGEENQGDAPDVGYQCVPCRKQFTHPAYLRQHAVTAHSVYSTLQQGWLNRGLSEEKQCDTCAFWFPNLALLQEHASVAHQN